MIAKFKRPTRIASIFAAALLVVMSCGLLTDAKDNPVPLTPEQVTAQQALDNKMEEGKRIFERSLEARGGRARFSQVKDVTFSANGKIASQGMDLDIVTYMKPPHNVRTEINDAKNGVRFTIAFNGKSGWVTDPITGSVQDMTDPVLEQLKPSGIDTQLILDPQRLYRATGFEGREFINGKEYLVIRQTSVPGFDSVLTYIDPDTYFPYKYIMSNVDGKIEKFVSDYRDVEGMQLPFIINMKMADKDEIEIIYKEWIINSNLEDSFFEGPSAWK